MIHATEALDLLCINATYAAEQARDARNHPDTRLYYTEDAEWYAWRISAYHDKETP